MGERNQNAIKPTKNSWKTDYEEWLGKNGITIFTLWNYSIGIISEIGFYAKLGICNTTLTDSILKAARAYN